MFFYSICIVYINIFYLTISDNIFLNVYYLLFFQKSAEKEDTMDVGHDAKVNAHRNVEEDVFSPAHNLSTQEVQDVVDNLVGSPEYPTACEVTYTCVYSSIF